MIYFDTTKTGRAGHQSGLVRVGTRLRAELETLRPGGVRAVEWADGHWRRVGERVALAPAADDWLLTPELFGPDERPGLAEFTANPPCRLAAVYYDAIPLKFPQTTWPHSVARHPGHLKWLAQCHRVFAISEASRAELEAYWAWSQPPRRAAVTTIPLGADGAGQPRTTGRVAPAGSREVLMVGILEPRKNQSLLLDVAERLHAAREPVAFHFVGRVNPHFGKPIERRITDLARRGVPVKHHGPLDDAEVRARAARCRCAVFPSHAEGNGLPVLEALWQGLPCVCSDLAPLVENARDGGCVVLPAGEVEAWTHALRELLNDEPRIAAVGREAAARSLPRWSDSAAAVLAALA